MEMWEKCCSDSKFVSLAAPRGHAKSTAITHTYTLANVCFRERTYVVIVSDTESQAIEFLGDIRRELVENEDLKTLFGVQKLTKDTEKDIIGRFTDGEFFRIVARGSEQKVRGRKWRSRRPDLIIGDDLENDEIVMNEERRAKFRRWINNALLPSGSDDCIIRIVGTILHLDSFLERTMPDFEDKEHTHSDGLRHWSTKKNKTWDSVRYKGHNEDFSMLLWPEKWPQERYEAERQRYVEDGNPEGYAQEYLNYPIDESSAFFQRQDFIAWKDPGEYLEYYVGVDLAISEKDQRAYTVFAVVGLNRQNLLVVVEMVRLRGDAHDIINQLFRVQSIYTPEVFFIEEENIARALGSVIDHEMVRRNIYLNIETMTPTKDKMQRARALQSRMRAGGMRFDMEKEWFPALQTEMVTFPRGKYMDQVDALSWIGIGLNSFVPTYSTGEIAQFEWDEEYDDDYQDSMSGRSTITGY
jgi:predicted phage terminase large subunit-like protein